MISYFDALEDKYKITILNRIDNYGDGQLFLVKEKNDDDHIIEVKIRKGQNIDFEFGKIFGDK